MTFTKNKLAAAMTGAFIAAAGSQSAFAVVDVDNTANAGAFVASESVLTTASVIQAGVAEDFALFGTLTANNIPASTDIRVTVTLNGGYTFAGAPTLTLADAAGGVANSTSIYVDALGAAAAAPTMAVFSGGGTSDGTVTFNANTGAGEVVGGAHFLFELNAAGLSTGGVQSNITADVAVAIADNFGPTNLPGHTGEKYISWSPIASLIADTTNRETGSIDVAQDSKFFLTAGGATGDDELVVGGWRVFENTASAPVSIAGAAVDTDDVSNAVRGTIVGANGLAAFNQGTSGGAVVFNGAGATSACTISTSDTTSAVCATYNPGATGDAAGDNDITVVVPAANTVRIAETTLVANVSATAANTAAFSASTVTGSVNLGSLARNGSSARLNFALTPGGAYKNFIRVTNPSSVAGPVTLTLTNDDGVTSAAIDISTITGGPAGDLAAGASTGLLSIDDVFAAVQAADATFDLGATNKLRVDVTAEFGGSAANQAVVLSAFNQSSDLSNFNMMTDASN